MKRRHSAWLAGLAILAAGAALPQTSRADKENFEKVCGACHPALMVSDLRAESEWKEVVAEMVKSGAKGTEDQLAAVMRYLRENWTKVNVNTATAAEIAPVLALNAATAEALVKRRAEKGSFRTIDELKQIPGVNAAIIDERKDRIAF